MSRFAAIEARATQSPASANDVVWLVARVRHLREALFNILEAPRHGIPTRLAYEQAREALAALDEPNLPL